MPPTTSSRRSGKRPSNWKALRRMAKLSRVAPVFVPRSSSSLLESVQCRASSSGCQSCFIGRAFGLIEPSAKSKLAAERVHDQSATAKLVEKEQSGRPCFCLLCRNFDLRYLRAYHCGVSPKICQSGPFFTYSKRHWCLKRPKARLRSSTTPPLGIQNLPFSVVVSRSQGRLESFPTHQTCPGV